MTVAEFKRLVVELDEEHDWKDIWYVEVSGHDEYLRISVDSDYGIVIVGDSGD